MIKNVTTFRCDSCGVEQYAELEVMPNDKVVIEVPLAWSKYPYPDDSRTAIVCNACRNKKMVFTLTFVDP